MAALFFATQEDAAPVAGPSGATEGCFQPAADLQLTAPSGAAAQRETEATGSGTQGRIRGDDSHKAARAHDVAGAPGGASRAAAAETVEAEGDAAGGGDEDDDEREVRWAASLA